MPSLRSEISKFMIHFRKKLVVGVISNSEIISVCGFCLNFLDIYINGSKKVTNEEL